MGSSRNHLMKDTLCLCLILGVAAGITTASTLPSLRYDVELKGVRKIPLLQGPNVFNVMKYGAVADGKTDNAKAFTAAWQAACNYGTRAAKLLIPPGTYLLGEVTFSGPCLSRLSPKVVIQGVLKATTNAGSYTTSSWITFRSLHDLVITGGGTLDGQGAASWSQSHDKMLPTSLKVISVSNGEIHGLKLVNSKAFHVRINKCTNFHLYALRITAPEDSPNTDGIHVSGSTGVVIRRSIIGVGDDCVSLGDGNTNITISDVGCGPGHGISVGSLGKYKDEQPVSGVHVSNCYLSGTTNGVRIKTWPGSPPLTASNMLFENIVMDRVSFPIIIDQNYCASDHCSDEPSKVKISDITYKNIRGTSFTRLAVNLICTDEFPCQNIQMQDINLRYQNTQEKTASMCMNVKPIASGIMEPAACV